MEKLISKLEEAFINGAEKIITDMQEKELLRRFFEEISHTIEKLIREDNCQSIISSGSFTYYIEHYNVVIKIYKYVSEYQNGAVQKTEDKFIQELTQHCIEHLADNEKITVDDSSKIYHVFSCVLNKTKNYVLNNDIFKKYLYSILQLCNEIANKEVEYNQKPEKSIQQEPYIVNDMQYYMIDCQVKCNKIKEKIYELPRQVRDNPSAFWVYC